MNEKQNTVDTQVPMTNTDLAFERTVLAYERTLMAWIRTAISMISFGFTIYKFFQELSSKANAPQGLFTPRIVGMLMIGFGFLSLLLAQVQHEIAIRKLKRKYPAVQHSISSLLSVLILFFGLTLFFAALFKQ